MERSSRGSGCWLWLRCQQAGNGNVREMSPHLFDWLAGTGETSPLALSHEARRTKQASTGEFDDYYQSPFTKDFVFLFVLFYLNLIHFVPL
jgi:hypothetical protein